MKLRWRPDPAPRVDAIILSDSMRPFVLMWREEIGRRYSNAVVVFVHGGDEGGQWVAVPDVFRPAAGLFGSGGFVELEPRPMTQVVRDIRAKNPGRRIVLMSCNPGHYDLEEAGVTYSHDSVWLMPDRYLDPRNQSDPDVDGNIYELQENP